MCPGPFAAIELIRVRLPLVRPFRTARGTHDAQRRVARPCHHRRRGRMGRVLGRTAPGYSGETLDGAPARRSATTSCPAPSLGHDFADVRGNHVRPSRARSRPARRAAARDRAVARSRTWVARVATVEAGVAIGLTDDEKELRALAAAYCAEGYRRIKLKIEPGADVAIVAAVRAEVGDDVTLAVDANGSYALEDADNTRRARSIRVAVPRAATRTGRDPRAQRAGEAADDTASRSTSR